MAQGPATGFNAAQALQRAYQLHRQGQFAQAEKLYHAVLISDPNHFDALHLFALLRLHQRRAAEALPLIEAALKRRPDGPDALLSAVAILSELGRHQEALPRLDRLLAQQPTNPDAHFNRGVVLTALGRHEHALASYDAALAIQPGHQQALFNLGNTFASLRRFEDALGCYDRLLAIDSNQLDASSNRGNALLELGRFEEARAEYARVAAGRPRDPRAITNFANALKKLSKPDEAMAEYDRALAIAPDSVETLYNRGNLLLDLRRPAEAERDLRHAARLSPAEADIHTSLAVALLDLRRPEESAESYRRALELKPDSPTIHSDLLFALNFIQSETTASQQVERARWYDRHARPLAATIKPHSNARDPFKRLRIGYVSSHFRHQAGTYAFGGVIANHDPDLFDIYCYSDTQQEDDVTSQLRRRVTRWHSTTGRSDEFVAELVRNDGIDILVDLVGHMQGHRLLVFARKPAPVQVTGWAEPTGTGLKTMDYLFADPVLIPEAERPLFAERIVDLPCCLSYWRPDLLPEPMPPPALSRDHVTFGSFNRLFKLIPPVLRTWAEILRSVPRSRLVLKDRALARPDQQAPLLEVFAEAGVAADRITFLEQTDRPRHFMAYKNIDIALDPFPHGGGMTTLDALWMGVPVVARPGATVASRNGAACLAAVGLDDFLAFDRRHYVEIAVKKASDVNALATLRAELRDRVAVTPVGNPYAYARAVENAYRTMWYRWCDPPV